MSPSRGSILNSIIFAAATAFKFGAPKVGTRKEVIDVATRKVHTITSTDKSDGRNGLQFILDTGATVHICNDASLFVKWYNYSEKQLRKRHCTVANGEQCKVEAIGDIEIRVVVPDADGPGEHVENIIITNVYYVPEMHCNLLSVRKLFKNHRIKTSFRDGVTIKLPSGTRIKLPPCGSQYAVSLASNYENGIRRFALPKTTNSNRAVFGESSEHGYVPTNVNAVSYEDNTVTDELIHQRLGHASQRRINLAGKYSRNPRLAKYREPKPCEGCAAGGSKNKAFQKATKRKYKFFGQRINSDLCGPFPKSASGNFMYAICFTDMYSKYAAVYYLKSKHASEVKAVFEQFIKDHRKWLGKRGVQEWFCDNGGEFCSNDLDVFCETHYIKRQYSVPYCPPQNGQAERLWGLLLRPMRIFFAESQAPMSFWPECMDHCIQLHNSMPKSMGKSPLQRMGSEPNLDKFRRWGCKVFHHVPERYKLGLTFNSSGQAHTNKLKPPSIVGIHLGIDPRRPGGYLIYLPQLRSIRSALYKDIDWRFESDNVNFGKPGANVQRHRGEWSDDDSRRIFINPDAPADSEPTTADKPKPGTTVTFNETTGLDEDANGNSGHPDEDFDADADSKYDHGDDQHFGTDTGEHCERPECTLGKHSPAVKHSFERTARYNDKPSSGTRSKRSSSTKAKDAAKHAVRKKYDHRINWVLLDGHTDDSFSISVKDNMSHDCFIFKVSDAGPIPVPSSYKEARDSPLWHKWNEAMEIEIKKLMQLHAWEIDSRRRVEKIGRRVCKSKWVYDNLVYILFFQIAFGMS